METIPRIIHQIWLWGKNLPIEFKRYWNTWKNHHPWWDYILWDDESINKLPKLDISILNILKNFSEKSDYLRFCIIQEFWWIYADTDFECLKSFENIILNKEFFIGREENEYCNAWLFWATKNNNLVSLIVEKIPETIMENLTQDSFHKIWPTFITAILEKNKIHAHVYDPIYFYPFSRFDNIDIRKRRLLSDKTFAIHHNAMSWTLLWRIKARIIRFIKKIFY
jgi:mannosyltransferase OCH1-like enzyme